MGKSLLELLRDVAVDPAEQAALQEIGVIPYLARHGYEDVDVEDLREATGLVADTLPPHVAQTLSVDSPDLIDPDQSLLPDPDKAAALEDVTPSAAVSAASVANRDAGAHGQGGSTTEAGDTPSEAAQDGPLAFGAGADTAATREEIGAGIREEAQDPDGGTEATADASSLHGAQPQDESVDTTEGVDVDDTFANDLPENPGDDAPDESAMLDDIGSF